MNANPKSHSAAARIDAAAVAPLPNSRKAYVTCSQPGSRVPIPEITQADTPTAFVGEMNSPIYVYDASGPCADPEARIDIRAGSPALHRVWIESRGDIEQLNGLSSQYGRERAAAPATAKLRFLKLHRYPRHAQFGENVLQLRYARRGFITPKMEYIAISESQRRAECLESLKTSGANGAKLAVMMVRQHPGQVFGANASTEITAEFVRQEAACDRATSPANVPPPRHPSR